MNSNQYKAVSGISLQSHKGKAPNKLNKENNYSEIMDKKDFLNKSSKADF